MRVFPPRNLVLASVLLLVTAAPLHAAANRLRTIFPQAQPTYTATPTPNPLTLAFVGDTKPVTVTTTIDPGFADPQITYSFSGFPAFIANDGPKSTTISGNYGPVVFNFTLLNGAVPGTYTGTLAGFTGPANAQRTFPFTVVVPQVDVIASFTQPVVQLCNGGASTKDAIQLTPQNYSGTPQVAFTSVPPGITVNPMTFSVAPMPPGETLPFTIAASGGSSGTFFVTANISDAGSNINKNIQLQVNVVNPNFTPFANPSTLALTAGGAAQNVDVSVVENACFSGSVTITASGQPEGMTVTPNPVSTAGPQVPMSIQAAASVPAGTYPITLTYSGGNIVKTLTIQVTVTAPDFTISANPGTLTLQPGASGTVMVSSTATSPITVTSPSTPDVVFTPATFTLTPGVPQTVTVSATASATPGTRPLQFTSGNHAAPFTLIIAAPSDFTLTATPPVMTLVGGATGTVIVSSTATSPITVTSPSTPDVVFTPATFTLTPGVPQSVTVAVAPNAVPGTRTLQFVSGTHTAPFTLIIPAPPDFRITVTPDTIGLADGGSASVAVGVVGINGFNGVVNITAPQLPGITFTPSTFTVAAGAAQNVTVTVAPGTPAAVTQALFSGNAIGIVHTALLTINITRRPDFTITATPPVLTMHAGGNAVVTITATGVNGFAGPIIVTAPPPSNLTFTPAAFTILPGQSQQVTIHANAPAQPKLYVFTATADGVAGEHQATVLVSVLPQLPILTAAIPSAVVAGSRDLSVRVAGDFFKPGAVFTSSNASLTIDSAHVLSPQLADLVITVRADAVPGPRTINIVNPDGGTAVTPLTLLVYPSSSIAAPLDVTAAAIVYPPRGTLIAPKEALYPRGLLATTGTGTIMGSWQFDGVPFDHFVVNAGGGMPVEVRTNMPLPVSFTGSHSLALVIESPRHVISPVIEVIDAIDRVSRLTLLAPRDGAVLAGRDQLFRWSLVPNCSGYDVEVDVVPLATFRVNDGQWRPSRDDIASIGPGIHRWRVRPRCAGDTALEASEWQRFAFLPEHVDLSLLPVTARNVRWTSGVPGLLYRVEFLAPDGNVIFSALTSSTEYLAPPTLPAGTAVRISAIAPNGAIVGTSSSSPLSRRAMKSHIALAQVTVIEFGALTPPDGSTVQNPQPRIAAEWKGAAKPADVTLLVDNTDITAVATVAPTSITYDSLIALAPGPHSVALSVAGNITRWTFNVEGAGATEATPAQQPRGDWVIAPLGTLTLVRQATNEAHTQLSALTDLDIKKDALTSKATGDLALRHDFDQDKTTQESRNWLTDLGAHQGTKASESLRVGFSQPDFFDQAQLVTAGLPQGGIQAKVVVPGGTASYYQTFTSRPAGVVTGLFGTEQRIKAAAFQVPFNVRWDFRVLALRTDEEPSFNSGGGQGDAFGLFARFNIGSTVSAIFEGAHGDFKPAFGSFEERHKGNAYRVGLTGMRGTLTYAFNLRRTESQFVNPANRGFTPGGVPDRTGADLTLGKFIGTTSVTLQLRHLQDGTSSGLLVPRTRETGGLLSVMKMLGSHVSLALSGNVTADKGEEKPEIFLPRADRTQSGATGTLSEFFGRFNFSETLTHQLLRDRINDFNDQTITSATLTGGGFLSQYFNLAAVLSGTRSAGNDFIIGTTDQYLASLQPTISIPKLFLSLQPRASYNTSKNDLFDSRSTTEQYQALVTFAPQWLGSFVAVQFSADWTKSTFTGQLGPSRFVHRYVGTFNFHWRAGVGPAYTNYVPFAAPGTPAAATPAAAAAGFPPR